MFTTVRLQGELSTCFYSYIVFFITELCCSYVGVFVNYQKTDICTHGTKLQSEHIGQWATPHRLSDVRRGAILDLGLLST